jgi:hypothetical protein
MEVFDHDVLGQVPRREMVVVRVPEEVMEKEDKRAMDQG